MTKLRPVELRIVAVEVERFVNRIGAHYAPFGDIKTDNRNEALLARIVEESAYVEQMRLPNGTISLTLEQYVSELLPRLLVTDPAFFVSVVADAIATTGYVFHPRDSTEIIAMMFDVDTEKVGGGNVEWDYIRKAIAEWSSNLPLEKFIFSTWPRAMGVAFAYLLKRMRRSSGVFISERRKIATTVLPDEKPTADELSLPERSGGMVFGGEAIEEAKDEDERVVASFISELSTLTGQYHLLNDRQQHAALLILEALNDDREAKRALLEMAGGGDEVIQLVDEIVNVLIRSFRKYPTTSIRIKKDTPVGEKLLRVGDVVPSTSFDGENWHYFDENENEHLIPKDNAEQVTRRRVKSVPLARLTRAEVWSVKKHAPWLLRKLLY